MLAIDASNKSAMDVSARQGHPGEKSKDRKIQEVSQLAMEEFGESAQTIDGSVDYSVERPLDRISGFTNYTPQQMRAFLDLKSRVARVYESAGFTPLEPRPVEYACNLQQQGGLEKQMFGVSRLQDGSLTKLALPFDRTVPLALFTAQNLRELTFPYNRYDIGMAFRGEHAKAGRYRAFYQADVDIIDRNISYRSDAECVITVLKALQAIGVKDCTLYLNHIGIAKAFLRLAGVPEEKNKEVLRILDKIKPDNKEEISRLLKEALPEVPQANLENLLQTMDYRGSFSEFSFPKELENSLEATEGFEHLKKLRESARSSGLDPEIVQFSPNLVRGLDYYTGIVFETFILGQEHFGSVASGGRYSKLVDVFSGKETGLEGVGGSIGLTRLFDVMQELQLVDLSRQTTANFFVGYRVDEETYYDTARKVAERLRGEGGKVELFNSQFTKVSAQYKLCNQKKIPFSIMVMNSNEIVLKDMQKGKEVPLEEKQQTFETAEAVVSYVRKNLFRL